MKLKAVASTATLVACAPSSTALVSGHAGRRRCVLPPRSAVPNDAQNEGSCKSALLDLLAKVPPNESTPRELTTSILAAVKALEEECPTPESDVLAKLAGNWELLWTAQDVSSLPGGRRTNPFATFINPLENQSYSNNPTGRSNPILPQNVQDGLEEIGILSDRTAGQSTVRSTQAINLDKKEVRNVVVFEANNPTPLFSKDGRTRGIITVDVRGAPSPTDKRRIDVKFDRCRVTLQNSPVDVRIPLGPIGPTGWLRTLYVDDDMRITRGHKGSVFVLSRTASK
ncbi:hypothetical protein ACHAXT_004237 [Thalassiosira profunda]